MQSIAILLNFDGKTTSLAFKINSSFINKSTLLIIFVVTMFALGLILVTINVPTSTKMMTIVEKDKLGKVSSLINVGSQGLIPLATFLAGIALQSLGASWLLGICSAGLILISIVIMINRQIAKL